MSGRLVAVTGAGGHVGANLVPALLARGDRVRAVDLRRPRVAEDVEWVAADVRDRAAVMAALDGVDVVFHLAAVISVVGGLSGLVEDVNVRGVAAVAAAAREAGVRRFVHCSSVHAFDTHVRGAVVSERTPPADRSGLPAYDRSKAAGERALRDEVERGLDAAIANPTGIIGPVDPGPSRMGAVFLAMRQGRLPALVEGGFDWVDVRDVVAGLLALEDRGRCGENYLLGGHRLSIEALARAAAECTGVAPPRLTVPGWLARVWSPAATMAARRTGNPLAFTTDTLAAVSAFPVVDCAKARAELAYHQRPIAETLTDFYAWYDAAHGPARTAGPRRARR